MVIPNSGAISLGTLQNEFRGASPSSMSEYFRNNVLVKDIAENGNIPNTFRAISLSNFRGASYTQGFGIQYLGGGNAYNTNIGIAASTPDPRRTIVVVHGVGRDRTGDITPGAATINGVAGNRILGQFSTVRDDGQGLAVTIARVTTGTTPTVFIPAAPGVGPGDSSTCGVYAIYGHYFPVISIETRRETNGGDINLGNRTIPIATPAGSAVMYIAQNNGNGAPDRDPTGRLNIYINSGIGVGFELNPPVGTTTYGYNHPNQPAFLAAISFYKEF